MLRLRPGAAANKEAHLLALVCLVPLTTTFARVGVRLAHAIPRTRLRLLFGIFLIATALNMLRDLIQNAG